jgi:hypothetical protein
VKLFPLADVLSFRRQNAETSGRYAAMSDADLNLEALKRARVEVFADAQQAAIDMQAAKDRMDRLLARHAALAAQVKAAEILLDERDRQRILETAT